MDDNHNNMLFKIDNDPYNHIIHLFCNRWKPYLIRALDFDSSTRYTTFTKQLPISERVLSRNLRELEQDGIILRTVFPGEVPIRVEYSLTEVGKSLIPLLDAMYDWGWNDMKRKQLPIDPLGEMWHKYRDKDAAAMNSPYRNRKN